MSLPTLPIHETLLHPRTGMPLRAVGFRKNGLPIWPFIGGDGTEGDANDTGGDAGDTSGDDSGGDANDTGGDNSWEQLFAGKTPAEVKTALDNSRKWETRSKDNKGKADQYDALVAAITGKNGTDENPDPEVIKGELTAAQQEARETKVENRILRLAGTLGANGTRLVDSRTFMHDAAKLDPNADDFGTQVEAAIKKAVADDAYFAATTGPRPTKQQGRPSEGKHGGIQSGADLYHQRRGKSSGATTS